MSLMTCEVLRVFFNSDKPETMSEFFGESNIVARTLFFGPLSLVEKQEDVDAGGWATSPGILAETWRSAFAM